LHNRDRLIELANGFREGGQLFLDLGIQPRAESFWTAGREEWSLWFLLPRKPETESGWVRFSLFATQAIEYLGIDPIPAPAADEYDPAWREQMTRRQEEQRSHGRDVDYSETVPHGLDDVDPGTRAWLHFLRREARAQRGAQFSPDEQHFGFANVWEVSATQCERLARDQILRGLRTGADRQKLAGTDGNEIAPKSQASKIVGRNPRRSGKKDPVVQRIKKEVRQLRAAGHDYKTICDRLGSSDRPTRASWKDDSWPLAYKRNTSAVRKWLSEACS
jgi:hypothetical protein